MLSMNKKKVVIISLLMISALIVFFLVGTGFQKRTDVVLFDYAVAEDGTAISLGVKVSSSMGYTNSWSALKLTPIESVIPSNHLILCHPLLFLPSVFKASGSFPVSQFFESGGQSIGVSALASVLPVNIQD